MVQFFELESLKMMKDGLEGSTKRQEAINQNLANINTPGYKRKEVSFKDSLREAYIDNGHSSHEMQTSHERHIDKTSSGRVQPRVYEDDTTSMRNDKNNVDPDREAVKNAKNSMYYQGVARMEKKIFGMLNGMISELKG